MGTYTKIKTIPLSIFNNAEYLAFLNSVLNLVPAPTGGGDRPEIESLDADVRTNGSPDIGLSAQFVQKMEDDVMLLADTVDESRIAQETEQAAVHEANRDNLVIYITTRILIGPLQCLRELFFDICRNGVHKLFLILKMLIQGGM